MFTVTIPRIGSADAWRNAARALLSNDVPPSAVNWAEEGAPQGLFAGDTALPAPRPLNISRTFLSLANCVVWHSDPERYARLYAFAHRLRNQPHLISDRADPALAQLRQMFFAIRSGKPARQHDDHILLAAEIRQRHRVAVPL